MKSLKIGFASIIAILAVSLTIAAQAGAFESKKRAVLPNCYIPTATLQYKTLCTATTPSSFAAGDNCAAAQTAAPAGTHIFGGLDEAFLIDPEEFGTLCPGDGKVCCVFVTEDLSPCAAPNAVQPQFPLNSAPADEYAISSIRCRN